jgi:hypothetical protein
MTRYAFLVDTYDTERLKVLRVWSMFEDEDMQARPPPHRPMWPLPARAHDPPTIGPLRSALAGRRAEADEVPGSGDTIGLNDHRL